MSTRDKTTNEAEIVHGAKTHAHILYNHRKGKQKPTKQPNKQNKTTKTNTNKQKKKKQKGEKEGWVHVHVLCAHRQAKPGWYQRARERASPVSETDG